MLAKTSKNMGLYEKQLKAIETRTLGVLSVFGKAPLQYCWTCCVYVSVRELEEIDEIKQAIESEL